ncbi:ParA family protein [Candidatus Symbiobacter mobilis]|uniref:Chromosome partitioning protein n=1 Tax=Candidatus Symbiobacter mobilis CR TaxID=946483 RepID=U5NAL0_9BURK|nr:ParA family protein [Candidatus Symbiobacter mobilis]AGX87298.1 chromosome partitioning protein [Candidatus Symbiobacter mobilis CR]
MTALQVIAISNRKGGTGKSTVSVNLSAELARLGRRVLLIDLDSQGHCAVGLGVKVHRDDTVVHSLFTDPHAKLSMLVRPTAFPNLSLAPADQRFEHGSGERDELRLARALAEEDIAQRFDVVIVDTPPSLDYLLLNALTAANWLMIPFVPHHLGFEGVLQLMRVLFKVISGPNPQLKILGFLPTIAADHIRQHRTISAEVSRQFGANRLLPGIRNDIRLAEAFAAGQPICQYAPKSRGAEDFVKLAAHIVPALAPQRME